MAKSDPKTMRFESDVEYYINAQKGENFSDKFHGLVRKFRDEEIEKQKKIARLDKEIAEKEKRIKDLNSFLFDVTALENHFKGLQRSIEGCKGYMENFLKKDLDRLDKKFELKAL